MSTIVIYKSKAGHAKKYAQWIAEELSAEIISADTCGKDVLAAYDTIIYGGGLYAAGINGVKMITRNLDALKDKKIIIFATGVTPVRKDDIKVVQESNFTSEQQRVIKFFYLRSGFDYSLLNPLDKLLMNLLKLKIRRKKKEDLTADERGMLSAYSKPLDFSNKKNIEELVSWARQ